MSLGDAPDEDHDGCGVEECGGGSDDGLWSFQRRRLRLVQAKKRSTQRLGLTARPLVARIGEDLANEGKRSPRGLQQGACAAICVPFLSITVKQEFWERSQLGNSIWRALGSSNRQPLNLLGDFIGSRAP